MQYDGKNKLDTYSHKIENSQIVSQYNEDGSFVLNGSIAGNTFITQTQNPITLPAGTYIFSSDFDMGTTDVRLWLRKIVNGQGSSPYVSSYTGHLSQEFTIEEESDFYMYVSGSTTFNNVLVKPMIRLASVTDDTYEPYCRTESQALILHINKIYIM